MIEKNAQLHALRLSCHRYFNHLTAFELYHCILPHLSATRHLCALYHARLRCPALRIRLIIVNRIIPQQQPRAGERGTLRHDGPHSLRTQSVVVECQHHGSWQHHACHPQRCHQPSPIGSPGQQARDQGQSDNPAPAAHKTHNAATHIATLGYGVYFSFHTTKVRNKLLIYKSDTTYEMTKYRVIFYSFLVIWD